MADNSTYGFGGVEARARIAVSPRRYAFANPT